MTAVTPGLYRASVTVPGFRATVSPSILSFYAPGQTLTFRVTLTRTTAAFGQYSTGFLTWNGANTSVRSPIAVRPVQLSVSVPRVEEASQGGQFSASWQVTTGFSGSLPLAVSGLTAGSALDGSVTATTAQSFPVDVPAGTRIVRFATSVPAPTVADIDLYVYRGTTLVAVSGGSTAEEAVEITNPTAGAYRAEVRGFADAPATMSTPFTFHGFVVPNTPTAFGFAVTPSNATVTPGQKVTVTATASGLTDTQQFLGWVGYPDGSGTTVLVN